MPSTRSVTCSRRAEASVSSWRISVNSIATAATSVKAQRWCRKAKSVDMGALSIRWSIGQDHDGIDCWRQQEQRDEDHLVRQGRSTMRRLLFAAIATVCL